MAIGLAAIGGALQGIADTGVSLWNAWNSYKTREQNQANLEKTWEREDTAVQRRVADLTAAGLSPTLAAGSAASTSSPIKLESPYMDKSDVMNNILASASMANTIKSQTAGIAQTKAQTELINAQKRGVDIDNARNARNFDIEKGSGMHSNNSSVGRIVRDAETAVQPAMEKAHKAAASAYEKGSSFVKKQVFDIKNAVVDTAKDIKSKDLSVKEKAQRYGQRVIDYWKSRFKK